MTGRMTFGEFVADMVKELKENPEFADMPVSFSTAQENDLDLLSLYENEDKVVIDIGSE